MNQKHIRSLSGLFFAIALLLITSCSEQAGITEKNYERAEEYFRPNISQKVYHLEVNPNWIGDGPDFWHVTNTREGKRFFLTLPKEGESREAFDHDELAAGLNRIANLEADPADLPFDRISFITDDIIEFRIEDLIWKYNISTGELESRDSDRERPEGVVSPDGRFEAFIRDYNIYVRTIESGEVVRLSNSGEYLYEYGNSYGWADVIEEPDGERPENLFVRWSPDSERLLTYIADLRVAEKMYMLDFTVDTLYRPRLLSYYRGSPGDTTIVYHIPVIFDINSGREYFIDVDPIPHFMNVNFQWTKEGRELFALYPHRGFKQVDIIRVDATNGEVFTVLSDHTDISIEYGHVVHERVGDDLLLFSSQRSGWNHLYMYNRNTGELVNQVTDGDFVFKRLVNIDEDSRTIYFLAGGREEGRNPYYDHLYAVNFDGSGLRLLSPEDAHHQVSVSPCGNYLLDNYSTPEMPTVSVVRELPSGDDILRVSEADIGDLLEMGWQPPISFTVKARDNETDIYGLLYRPAGFSSRSSYPLINYTYTGPHASIVPKSFSTALINIMVPFTEFGFAVMVVDGLGTAQRSLDFRSWSYRNIGGNVDCHVAAIEQLSGKFSWLNTADGVGIFGHSAGGYDVGRAMLMHPDVFTVGVASAADHDHRMEKAWWPEMFMGYPVGDFYHEQSNITNAAKLEGHLLIAHGAIDENVNPSASYKLAEYLIRDGKDFDMLILPGRRHSFGRDHGDYFTKVRWNYFIRHLLGEEPVHNYQFRTLDEW